MSWRHFARAYGILLFLPAYLARRPRAAILHGIAGWFDVSFDGSQSKVVLSTGPHAPGTHWYQCRLLLPQPIAVNAGQSVSGVLNFKANEHYSYDIEMEGKEWSGELTVD